MVKYQAMVVSFLSISKELLFVRHDSTFLVATIGSGSHLNGNILVSTYMLHIPKIGRFTPGSAVLYFQGLTHLVRSFDLSCV